jgi:hypothetical protein
MESVYHIITIRVNEISWAHVWRLRSRYLKTGYDIVAFSLVLGSILLHVIVSCCAEPAVGMLHSLHLCLSLYQFCFLLHTICVRHAS